MLRTLLLASQLMLGSAVSANHASSLQLEKNTSPFLATMSFGVKVGPSRGPCPYCPPPMAVYAPPPGVVYVSPGYYYAPYPHYYSAPSYYVPVHPEPSFAFKMEKKSSGHSKHHTKKNK